MTFISGFYCGIQLLAVYHPFPLPSLPNPYPPSFSLLLLVSGGNITSVLLGRGAAIVKGRVKLWVGLEKTTVGLVIAHVRKIW